MTGCAAGLTHQELEKCTGRRAGIELAPRNVLDAARTVGHRQYGQLRRRCGEHGREQSHREPVSHQVKNELGGDDLERNVSTHTCGVKGIIYLDSAW